MDSPQDGSGLLLPAGCRLVHVGPQKTGTTAVQSAFLAAEAQLAEHGVHYFGQIPGVRNLRGALAVTERRAHLGERQPSLRNWEKLVADVAACGDDRVLISSEFFADARDDAAAKVVRELGPSVHVVVTLRPLAKIIVSQWQQYVQNGLRMSYDDWLDRKLNGPLDGEPNPSFWHRHRHDHLVRRWAAAAGAQNVTVVMAREGDRGFLPRTFEGFFGLPDGFLQPEEGKENRALTLAEVEMVRRLNEEFRDRDWPETVYRFFIREGAVASMKLRSPDANELSIETPAWALKRVADIGAEAAAAIEALGVRVVGDLSALGWTPEEKPAASQVEPELPLDAVVRAMVGVVEAREPVRSGPISHRRVRDVTAGELLGVVRTRFTRRLRRKLNRADDQKWSEDEPTE